MKNKILVIAPLVATLMLAKIPIAHAETDCTQVTQILPVECEALLDFYASTNGPNWIDNQGWNETNTPCNWHGISCYNKNVSSVMLGNNRLTGSLPESLGNFSHLTWLRLEYNQLSGSLPESLGNLSNLWVLELSNNQLSGSIPESLGNFSRLHDLELYHNQLSGSIPKSLGNLSNLQYLELHHNQLNDSIPESLGNLSNLRHLKLHHNQLSGSIPESLANLSSLWELELNSNQLCGDIPLSLMEMSNYFSSFSLNNNHLTTSHPELIVWLNKQESDWAVTQTPCPEPNTDQVKIPITHAETDCTQVTEIPQVECEALLDFYISTHGSSWKDNDGWNETNTPCNWYGISCDSGQVTRIELAANQVIGFLPESLGNLSRLESLVLRYNLLVGSIPESLGNLSHLQTLSLWKNRLSGSIPESLGNLSRLESLYLYRNQLTGSIPESLGNLSRLESLNLANNRLSGFLPESLGNLSNLQTLKLNNYYISLGFGITSDTYIINGNKFSGSIPESWGNLSKLELLYLDYNQLCGNIPSSLMEISDYSLQTCPEPRSCQIYGVHDEGLNDSQLFTIDEQLAAKPLGETHFGLDIEGLDIHPGLWTLFAAVGDKADAETDALYTVNKDEGTLTLHCRTGLNGISALSFHPFRHDLWAWADGEGLFAIDTIIKEGEGVCAKTKLLPSPAKLEALTWDTRGQKLYGVAGTILYQYEKNGGKASEKCHDFPAKIEALEIAMFDGNERLLFVTHHNNKMVIDSFDVETCSIIESFPLSAATEYTDIEGIALECH